MRTKTVFCLALVAVLIYGVPGGLWADLTYQPYNRPNPLMDYAPQQIGIYDTMYEELKKRDCRQCHGGRRSRYFSWSGDCG